MWIKNFGILGLEITVNGSKVKKDAVEEVSNSWYFGEFQKTWHLHD